jgi:hypothetical protein
MQTPVTDPSARTSGNPMQILTQAEIAGWNFSPPDCKSLQNTTSAPPLQGESAGRSSPQCWRETNTICGRWLERCEPLLRLDRAAPNAKGNAGQREFNARITRRIWGESVTPGHHHRNPTPDPSSEKDGTCSVTSPASLGAETGENGRPVRVISALI